MKIRIKFRKYGVMRFIGHLDVMRFFQKAIRRSGIDICYSEGFSPHQIMSFAAPLGVGLTSDGEYLDIEVHSTASTEASMRSLNAAMVDGMEITGYVKLPDHAKTAMSIVAASDYEVWFKESYVCPCSAGQLREALHQFFELPKQVLVTKKTKKSEKTLDLKQLVYVFEILEPEHRFLGKPAFYFKLCTGSTDNVKPEQVLEAFFAHIGIPYDPYAMQIHRRDVYFADSEGCFRTLLEEGEEIGNGEPWQEMPQQGK